MLRTLLAVGLLILNVAACTAGGGAGSAGATDPAAESAAPSAPSASQGASPEPAAGGVSLPPEITDPIVADAATRLGVETSAVTIVDAHAETWPDGSLGCPEPGMMYTQALVEGYQVVVEANGTTLDYRGGGVGRFQLCKNP